jgi:diguanylate cyclase (GGDEF)-like protein
MRAPLPPNEDARIAALREYQILDTPAEREYDDITLLAAQICNVPVAIISLVDEHRQWFKSKVGLDVDETPRDVAFCAHAILQKGLEPMIITDALLDPRFSDNPLVTGDPNIRFYAGAPLITKDNIALGTLCVIDQEPHELSNRQIEGLQALARQVALRLELQRASNLLQKANEELENLSLTDDLTGLYNSRGFFLHADQQLKLFRERKVGDGLWLMVADMDGLKKINDTYGHMEGSSAIRRVGEIMRKSFRDSDIIARPAGDEFLVLAINAGEDLSQTVPSRIEESLEIYNKKSGKPYEIAVSYGLVNIEQDGLETMDAILRRADALMYEHKRSKYPAR